MGTAIKLSVVLNKAYYEPSEPVIATVKILNDPYVDTPAAAHVKELTFQAVGQERTDPSWIGKLWKPECKSEATENRRNVRTIFRTETASLLAAAAPSLSPGAQWQFHVRFRLPSNLPPSFKGSSLRFTYTLEVRAVYELRTETSPAATFETVASTTLLVWPPHTSPRQGSTAAVAAGVGAGDVTPRHSAGLAASQQLPAGAFGTVLGSHRDRTSGDGSAGGTSADGEGLPAAGSHGATGTTPASASGLPEDLLELPLCEYRLQQLGVKVRVLDASSGSGASQCALETSCSGTLLAAAAAETMNGKHAASMHTLGETYRENADAASALGSGSPSASGMGPEAGRGYTQPPGSAPQGPGWPMSEALSFASWGGGGSAGSCGGAPSARTPGAVGTPASPLRAIPGHARAASAGAGGGSSGGGLFGGGGSSPALAPSPSPSTGGASTGVVGAPPTFLSQRMTLTPYAAASTAAAAAAGIGGGTGTTPSAAPSTSATPHPDASDDSDQEAAGTLGRRAMRPPLLLATGAYASAKSHQQQQLQQQQQQYQQQRQLRVSESSSVAGGHEPASPHASGAGPLAHHHSWPARSNSIGAAPQIFGKSFVLSASGVPVLKLTLQAPLDGLLQPGNTFGGLLDFRLGPPSASSAPALRCHQVSVMLETEELIAAQHSSRPASSSGRGGSGRVIRVLHCEQQEVTSDAAASHFLFTIPSAATPSFRSPMVSLRWVLRFELIVGPPIDYTTIQDGQTQWGRGGSGKGSVAAQLQQLVWPLPLVVLAPQTIPL